MEKIKFFSNRTDFIVTLMNENYNRMSEVTADKNYTENLSDTQRKILEFIQNNPSITQKC